MKSFYIVAETEQVAKQVARQLDRTRYVMVLPGQFEMLKALDPETSVIVVVQPRVEPMMLVVVEELIIEGAVVLYYHKGVGHDDHT